MMIRMVTIDQIIYLSFFSRRAVKTKKKNDSRNFTYIHVGINLNFI